MRWPFVFRAGYDELRREHAAMRVEAQKCLDEGSACMREAGEWRRMYEALLDKYHALRVAGGNPSVPMPAPEFDKVREAIVEKAGGNPRLERHLMREAAKLRLRNKSDDEIIEAVTHWRDPSAEESA